MSCSEETQNFYNLKNMLERLIVIIKKEIIYFQGEVFTCQDLNKFINFSTRKYKN